MYEGHWLENTNTYRQMKTDGDPITEDSLNNGSFAANLNLTLVLARPEILTRKIARHRSATMQYLNLC